jgi:hypothetical protein
MISIDYGSKNEAEKRTFQMPPQLDYMLEWSSVRLLFWFLHGRIEI